MRKTGVHVGGMAANNLFRSYGVYPQVVFTTGGLGTNPKVKPSLYGATAQLCAQRFSDINSEVCRLITILHRPNNDYNKGNN